MDDRPVESLQSFRLAIAEKRPGSRVRLVVVRDGDRRTIERPGRADSPARAGRVGGMIGP